MNYQHDLRLVRMNKFDQTFHCDVHGLLPDDEARDVLNRSGLTSHGVVMADEHGSPLLKWLYEIAAKLGRPKCVALS